MKKVLKITIIIIILSILSITVVYAAIKFDSADVLYNNSTSGLSSEYLQDAIDKVDKACTPFNNCPSNMTCKSNIPKCKRATTLHTNTCQQSSNYCSAVEGNGNTITYGSLGTNGVLTPGDAFDCKVSTTGDYTERFYYVSDYYDTETKSFNGEIAVLIYYTNTLNGVASTSGAAYNSSNKNCNGPVTAVTHLPLASTWNNVSLYKTNRQILTETNTTSTSGGSLPVFDYSGKAARLLTYREVYNGCYKTSTSITSTGGLNNCNFLFENTNYYLSSVATYGPWLESPRATYSDRVYFVNSSNRNVSYNLASNTSYGGVRPTIEVLKSNILY